MTHRIITRAEWGAQYGNGKPTSGAKLTLVTHHDGHTRSKPGMSEAEEAALMRFYENFHVHGDKPGSFGGLTGSNPRIAYTAVVMQTGRIYEACGFGRIGAHTENMNSSAYAFFLPLNGAVTAPTPEAIAAFHWLRAEAVRLGYLAAHHVVKGHQDFNKPSCPGKLVYDAIVLGCAPTNVAADAPAPADAAKSRPTLRKGKGGTAATALERAIVSHLQGLLIVGGFMPAKLDSGATAATGYFGDATEAAVKRFQSAKGLTADGIVGAGTWDALE